MKFKHEKDFLNSTYLDKWDLCKAYIGSLQNLATLHYLFVGTFITGLGRGS